jgi:hypothetical protein
MPVGKLSLLATAKGWEEAENHARLEAGKGASFTQSAAVFSKPHEISDSNLGPNGSEWLPVSQVPKRTLIHQRHP